MPVMSVVRRDSWPAKFRQFRRLSASVMLGAALAACGGGGSDDSVDMAEAFTVLGQADFLSGLPNRGVAADASTMAQPLGNVATDGSRLFVADTANNRILAYTSSSMASGAAADFVLGQADSASSDGKTSRQGMALPSSVFIGNGRLVVADSGNNRVLIWNSIPAQAGTAPDVVVGQADFATGASGTTQARLAFPTSAIIANNRLLVADQNNNRVLIWNSVPTVNGAAADLVLGQKNFTTRIADDAADEMSRPASLWSDGFRLLVSDSGNHRVLYWSLLPGESSEEATYVIGQSDFNRSSAGTAASGLRTPFGVTSDGTRIYVADSGNNRVLEFGSFPIANGVSATYVYGQGETSFAAAIANDDDQDGQVDDTPSARTLSGPSGVFVYSGVLYVSDRNNNRLMLFPQ